MQPIQSLVESQWITIENDYINSNDKINKEALIKKTNEQTSLMFIFAFKNSAAFEDFPKELCSTILDFKQANESNESEIRSLDSADELVNRKLDFLFNFNL